MKFGDNLRKLRKSKKISQEKLAEKVGVSRQSVSKWECGDAYPEMNHILILCKIFKCHINDLVHEDFSDIDLLDEEIKVNIVKFKKEKQIRMKKLSKFIYMIARISRILCIVGMIAIAITIIIIPVIGSKLNIEDSYIAFDGNNYPYEIDEMNRLIMDNENIKFTIDVDSSTNIKDYLENVSVAQLVFNGEVIVICIAITICFVIKVLQYLEKLFMNIYREDTPFTLENVQYIKKIAMYIALVIIFPFVSGMLFQLWSHIDMNIEFELMNAVIVLIIFAMAYIFEYGYEIQLDSKGKMYGDENE